MRFLIVNDVVLTVATFAVPDRLAMVKSDDPTSVTVADAINSEPSKSSVQSTEQISVAPAEIGKMDAKVIAIVLLLRGTPLQAMVWKCNLYFVIV